MCCACVCRAARYRAAVWQAALLSGHGLQPPRLALWCHPSSLISRPPPLAPAVGIVNKAGADYLGLLVLGCINVAVAADAIRAEFRPRLLVSEQLLPGAAGSGVLLHVLSIPEDASAAGGDRHARSAI